MTDVFRSNEIQISASFFPAALFGGRTETRGGRKKRVPRSRYLYRGTAKSPDRNSRTGTQSGQTTRERKTRLLSAGLRSHILHFRPEN